MLTLKKAKGDKMKTGHCFVCRAPLPNGEHMHCSDECYFLDFKWQRDKLSKLTIDGYREAHRNNCLVCRENINRPLPKHVKDCYCSLFCQKIFKSWFKFPKTKTSVHLYKVYLQCKLMQRYGNAI